MTNQELIMFANDNLLTERYRLDFWPLFALGDGGGVPDISSDSLIRVQAFSAIAYGARGLYYYCYEHGVWNATCSDPTPGACNYEPLANYMVVKKVNADAAKWGTMLLESRHTGAVRSPSDPQNDHSIAPGPGRVVEQMDDQLLVGVFSDGLEEDTGYLVVVDLRTDVAPGAVPPRTVTLSINPACSAAVVPGDEQGWFAEANPELHRGAAAGSRVTVRLHGGGGALLRLTPGSQTSADGSSGGCGAMLRSVRQWWYDPRTINLRHSYPEVSLKAATFGGSQWMPQGFTEAWDRRPDHQSGGSMARDATGQGFGRGWCNQRPCLPGRNRFFYKPGGLAGAENNYIIGGSQWRGGASAVWSSDAEAKAWADAAFSVVSFAASSSATTLAAGLDYAAAHGMFVLATPQTQDPPSAEVLDAAQLLLLANNFSCHTNWAGFVLASNFSAAGTDAHAVVKGAEAMRSVAYWTLPLILGVADVSAAVDLGERGVPFPAVHLPLQPQQSSAQAWAQALVKHLAPLAGSARNATMTPAVSLDACATKSDSLLRFAAYMSVLLGSQALWWEGMEKCAPVGGEQFATVSSINRRVSQFAEPLFLRKTHLVPQGHWLAESDSAQLVEGLAAGAGPKAGQSVPPYGPTDYFIQDVFSTSSIELPKLRGANGSLVSAVPPGNDASSIVQSMDKDLIVVHMINGTSLGENGSSYCKSAATVQGQDCITYDSILWILSTQLSFERGGAASRQLNVSLHDSVWTTHPVEPDAYQGFTTDCNLGWLGPLAPLKLSGGSVQVVSYSLGPMESQQADENRQRRVGRKPPRPWRAGGGAKTDDLDLVFSPPIMIVGQPGREVGADSFAAVDVDPAGERSLLYSDGWTSYDSGRTWADKQAVPSTTMPQDTGWTGESSNIRMPDGRVHSLGAIEDCAPNGCWTNNHTRSSCNNVSTWPKIRNRAWAGCNATPPPAYSEEWMTTSPLAAFWYKNKTDGQLWTSYECKQIVFRGIPRPLNTERAWGMCDGFTQPSILHLADDSVLATFPLVFAGEQPPRRSDGSSLIVNHLPMSLVVFRSVDQGFSWDFMSVAANYSQIPGITSGPNPNNLTHSAYGPQENGMALLRDKKTIMIAFRPDTDSMCPGGPVPYKFYFQVYSTDHGRSWSEPTPIHGVGCVRPRLLSLQGSLLMTGGRLCPDLVPDASFAGHGCLPQGGNGQGGIFLWANSDGMADAPAGTAKRGAEWKTYCLGAIHNRLWKGDPKYLFTNCSVKTGQCGSQTYNSIVPLGEHSAGIFYQNGYAGSSASTWMMRVDLKRKGAAVKNDDEVLALAPSLGYDAEARHEVPRSRAAELAGAGAGVVFVDCDKGSDGNDGRSVARAVATLEKAKQLVRSLRKSAADRPTVVEIRGECYRSMALELTAQDSGTDAAPVVWRGMDGAMLSAGRKIANWTHVHWPGAPAQTVLRADVRGWPKEIKSLRRVVSADLALSKPDDQWIPRTRWPKQQPGNYSSGWLSSQNWSTHESVGLDPTVVPPHIYADGSNVYVNVFGLDGEKDVINDISQVTRVNTSVKAQPSLGVQLPEGTEKGQRFFLENVRSALSAGSFYLDHNTSSLYVWPLPEWGADFEAVAPVDFSVLKMNQSHHVVVANLTFRDSGYDTAGCWCGPAGMPSDSAIAIWNSSHVTIEASTFLPGVTGYAVAATGGGKHLHIVGNRVSAVGQGGFLLYSKQLPLACNHSVIEHNLVERGGKILKHVSGVGLRAASWSVVRHNRILDMPRYAMDADTIIPNEIAIGNTFEHNIMDGSSLETSDTGAMEFTGQGAMFKLGWDMNTTIRYNNISRVMGADAVDGVHVCVRGDNNGAGPPGAGCRNREPRTVALMLWVSLTRCHFGSHVGDLFGWR